MAKRTPLFLLIICLCVIEIFSQTTISDELWVMPPTYIDDGKPYLELTCGSYLKKGEALVWLKSDQTNSYTYISPTHEDGYKTLKLLWPLADIKNQSKIYCARNKGSDWIKKNNIYISFQTVTEPLENEWLWVWPNTTAVNVSTNIVDLACWAYLYVHDTVAWYQTQRGEPTKLLAIFQQKYGYGYVKLDLKKNILPSDNGAQIFCSAYDFNKKETRYSETISLMFRQQEIEDIETDKPKLWVTPGNFTDNGSSVMDFTCHTYLKETDLMSWFQVKDSNTSERLETIQQGKEPGYRELRLLKGLKASDNGSQIFCASESAIMTDKDIFWAESGHIPIIFETQPYITVEPSKDIIIFKGGRKISLVCGGSKPINNREYIWHTQGPHSHEVELNQYFNESTNQKHLDLLLDATYHQSRLYCSQEYKLNIILTGKNHKSISYGELVRSHVITLLDQEQGNPEDEPQVTPTSLVGHRKLYMNVTCFAFALPGEVLSWYQSRESDQTDDILLSMVQQDHKYKTGQWLELPLNKTLTQADDKRDIYCAKQNVLQDGKFSDGLKSQTISVSVQRDIKLLVTSIKIEPNTNVSFDVNSSLRFKCSGSTPVDGRSYIWFRIDSESILTIPEEQKQVSPNVNVLELTLNGSYHQSRLFCAQVFLTRIQHSGASWMKHYGELVKSDNITLVLRGEETWKKDGAPLCIILAVAVPLLLVVIVVAAAVFCFLRRRRAPCPAPRTPPAPDKEEHLYANVSKDMESTELTYAELQFSPSTRKTTNQLKMDQTCEYATIVSKSVR